MTVPQLLPKSRLHGVSIFLSASVPASGRGDEFTRIPEAAIRIEESVVCVARAIFMEGGTLVFGAHPSISPLVARVADHYHLPAPAEELGPKADGEGPHVDWKNPSVVIYQSLVWKKYWAEATERLARHPLVQVHWIEAAEGEVIDLEVTDRPQAPRSMEMMRKDMIRNTAPAAMVAIGGMEGVLEEARLFTGLQPNSPIFALETTGGAAALLPEQEYGERVQVADREAEALVREFWENQGDRESRERFGEHESPKLYVPYAFVAQQIVEQIVENTRGREG